MDIKILDSWLREHLETKANAQEFAKYVSLSGPTVDRVKPSKAGSRDKIYEIEVTTNRVDAMSVYGVAREASTILPIYKIPAKLNPIPQYSKKLPTKGPKLTLKIDSKLTSRLMGVVIEDIKNWKTPKWMVERLESAGMRSLNAVVDITNYVMHEVGHPCHVFDYDLIPNQKIVVRESKKGEEITSFDGKVYALSGGDIVFDDGDGNIIDLPGIIGLKNSVVNNETKRVLFFFDTNDPKRIRKTSMELAIRTNAAVLNEKGVDPNLAEIALKRGLILFEEICKAKITSPIYDAFPAKYKPKFIETSLEFINSRLGIELEKNLIKNILDNLGFKTEFVKNNLKVEVPSFRATDMNIPEDIVEEIARMYGYHNLPSKIMSRPLPELKTDKVFEDERKIKDYLVRLGGVEVYTFSLVSKEMTGVNSLKLSNPLGSDTEYLRNKLDSSLVASMDQNKSAEQAFLFEMSNVFIKKEIPPAGGLPEERMMLGAIFKGYEYREAKGIGESLLDSLHINNLSLNLEFKGEYIYFEFSVEELRQKMKDFNTYKPAPNFPAQVEDITLNISSKQKVGDVFEKLKNSHKNISRAELVDIYEDNYTFRIWFQDPKKTLTDSEVEKIRKEVLKKLALS